MNRRLKAQIWRAIQAHPIGQKFTTADISEAVTIEAATANSIGRIIRTYPGIVNERPGHCAVWRRTE